MRSSICGAKWRLRRFFYSRSLVQRYAGATIRRPTDTHEIPRTRPPRRRCQSARTLDRNNIPLPKCPSMLSPQSGCQSTHPLFFQVTARFGTAERKFLQTSGSACAVDRWPGARSLARTSRSPTWSSRSARRSLFFRAYPLSPPAFSRGGQTIPSDLFKEPEGEGETYENINVDPNPAMTGTKIVVAGFRH